MKTLKQVLKNLDAKTNLRTKELTTIHLCLIDIEDILCGKYGNLSNKDYCTILHLQDLYKRKYNENSRSLQVRWQQKYNKIYGKYVDTLVFEQVNQYL